MNRVVKNWEATSNNDLRTAEAMYKAGRYLYVVFMCHLAIVKMLRAILAQKDPEETLPKIHNLIHLAQKIGLSLPDPLRDFFQRIDNVSVATRYPGDYCFASSLVRVAPDTGKVLLLFLVHMMNSPDFQAEAKGKASKSINQSNINATVMQNIKVPVPSLNEQRLFVSKIEALEKQIAAAQAVIDAAPARKEAVMKKYL